MNLSFDYWLLQECIVSVGCIKSNLRWIVTSLRIPKWNFYCRILRNALSIRITVSLGSLFNIYIGFLSFIRNRFYLSRKAWCFNVFIACTCIIVDDCWFIYHFIIKIHNKYKNYAVCITLDCQQGNIDNWVLTYYKRWRHCIWHTYFTN